MEHLSPETLARLLDEAPSTEERGHLNRCRRCRDELDALRAQTLALSHLPDLRPPSGDWDRLEPRLRREGLLRHRRVAGGFLRRGGQAWLQVAAGLLLLLTGAGVGAGFAVATGPSGVDRSGGVEFASGASNPAASPFLTALGGEEGSLSLEEAENLVRLTEGWYLEALLRYRERAGTEGPGPGADQVTRYAALEALTAAGHAAVREFPADPFLNGLLVNMEAERAATLRGMYASTTHDWY